MTTQRWTTARRRTRLAVAAVAAVGLGLSVVACGGDGSREESVAIESEVQATPGDALARAAEATSAVQTGRMRVTADYRFEVDGETASAAMEMEGSFSDQGRRSEVTADMGAYLRELGTVMGEAEATGVPDSFLLRTVVDGSRMYMKFDAEPAEPGMEFWYLTDMAEMGLDTSAMESPGGLGGPTSYLESLKGAGTDVVDAGNAEIDGVAVHRYEGTVDPQTAIDRADPEKRGELRRMLRQSGMTEPMPFVAYVDDEGLLRRQEMTMTMTMGPGNGVTATMVVDYYDFGADLTVALPPEDLVRPASELTGAPA